MSSFLILYASASGNTEIMADTMAKYLMQKQQDVTIKNFDFDPITTQEITNYDAVLIGIYTYDYGEIPYEVEFFYDELDEVDLTGCIGATFGAGDSFYGETYGLAVDLMHEKLTEHGAQLHPARLKVDMTPNQKDIEKCEQLAEGVLVFVQLKQSQQ
jgi:flavodoxin I